MAVEAKRSQTRPPVELLGSADDVRSGASSLAAKPVQNINLSKQISPFANSDIGFMSASPDRLQEARAPTSSSDEQTLLDGFMALELALFTCWTRKTIGLDGVCTQVSLLRAALGGSGVSENDKDSLYVPSLVISRHLVHPYLIKAEDLILGSSHPFNPAALTMQDNALPPLPSPLPLTPAGINAAELSSSDLQSKSLMAVSRIEGIRIAAKMSSSLPSHSTLEKTLMSAIGVIVSSCLTFSCSCNLTITSSFRRSLRR